MGVITAYTLSTLYCFLFIGLTEANEVVVNTFMTVFAYFIGMCVSFHCSQLLYHFSFLLHSTFPHRSSPLLSLLFNFAVATV